MKQMKWTTKGIFTVLLAALLSLQTAMAQVINGTTTQTSTTGTTTTGTTYSKLSPELSDSMGTTDSLSTLTSTTLSTSSSNLSMGTSSFGFSSPLTSTLSTSMTSLSATLDPPVRLIVRLSDTAARISIYDKIARVNGHIVKSYNSFGLYTVEVPRSRIRNLGADPDIVYLSSNRPVKSFGHVETTTAAAQARSLGGSTTFDGSGVGIAILDSGIDANHNLLKQGGVSRVVYSQDFTGSGLTGDTYGHGSHVASLAVGSSDFSGGAYTGTAPGANLLNLRVLDNDGQGTSSNLIAALDWCITYKAVYNIRIINMSLGTVAVDSYQFDPLCLAARRAHDAGIVVVCAAGNLGKDSEGA